MPPKYNKAASSTARQTRSATRARNAAARPGTPNREDVSPPRPITALSNSLAQPGTPNRDDVSPPRPSTPMSNSSARPVTHNREDISPPRPNTDLSSQYALRPPIRIFCHTTSPAVVHNAFASHYVTTPPNFLDSRRARSPATVNHRAFSFRHSSPPLISTNLAEMQNAFSFHHTAPPLNSTTPAETQNVPSFRHTASPLNGTTPAHMHNAFSFRHTASPLNASSSHPVSSPPRMYDDMQASHLLSTPPNVSNARHPINRPRFHNARSASHSASTQPHVGASHHATIPRLDDATRFHSARLASPPVPTQLNDRSPLRFRSNRLSSSPVPTPHNSRSSRFRIARPFSPPVPTPLNERSPLRFHSTRPSSPPVPTPLNGVSPRFRYARPSSPLRFHSPLAPSYVVTPPGSGNGLAPISDLESSPRRMASEPGIRHEANAFNITVDLTDSPLAVARHLNATVDLTDSPLNDPIPPMENPGGASARMENSPAATPGTSPIRCPVCLDSHTLIASTGRSLMSTVCGHIFCSACLPVCIRSSGRCPTCRRLLRPNDMHPVYI